MRCLHLFAIVALAVAATSSVWGQVDTGPKMDPDAAKNSPLLLVVPDAAALGPPAWVKPGVRITFYGMSGRIPDGGEFVKNANGDYSTADGTRYALADAVGGGGEGYLQCDVVAVSDQAVALSSNLFLIAQPGVPAKLRHFPMGGMIAAAAGPADFWIHPKVLANAQQVDVPGLTILRGPYTVASKTFPTLCIVSRGGGNYQSHAYDLNTGVLISSTVSAAGGKTGPSWERTDRGVTITKFVGMRQLQTPGVNGRNPNWAMRVQEMSYVGQGQYVNTFDPSVRMNFPASMQVTFGKRGAAWCAFKAATSMQIPGTPPQNTPPLDGICGPAGGFWIDPAALADLKAGQVLDDDPVTRIRTAVTAADAGLVTIGVQGPGVSTAAVYDRANGRLLQVTSHVPTTGFTTVLQLKGMK